jgi:hypothetical protein
MVICFDNRYDMGYGMGGGMAPKNCERAGTEPAAAHDGMPLVHTRLWAVSCPPWASCCN